MQTLQQRLLWRRSIAAREDLREERMMNRHDVGSSGFGAFAEANYGGFTVDLCWAQTPHHVAVQAGSHGQPDGEAAIVCVESRNQLANLLVTHFRLFADPMIPRP